MSRVMAEVLGERVTSTLFRAGRIDAVYGLLVESGQRRLLKLHRRPVDIEGRRLVNRAQSLLADAGLPCATPLAGPSIVDDQVVSVESLLPAGQPGDGFNAGVQMAVAEGLAQQVTLLAAHSDVIDGIGRPPAWCYYERGAWGATHDPIFDFRTTPSEYAWLQDYAQDAADELNTTRTDARVVAAHADGTAATCGSTGTVWSPHSTGTSSRTANQSWRASRLGCSAPEPPDRRGRRLHRRPQASCATTRSPGRSGSHRSSGPWPRRLFDGAWRTPHSATSPRLTAGRSPRDRPSTC
ncbi:MAG: hypothetical protein M3256_01530 [Actinomycetota bacterium]|nr:hypothetical protein [Actinomycetota bacterium]